MGMVVLAKRQGRPVAGSVYFNFGDEAIYKYGASDEPIIRICAAEIWSCGRPIRKSMCVATGQAAAPWAHFDWQMREGLRSIQTLTGELLNLKLNTSSLTSKKQVCDRRGRVVRLAHADFQSAAGISVTGCGNRFIPALGIEFPRRKNEQQPTN